MAPIPSSTRKTTYSPVASVGPFAVPFPIFDPAGADLVVTLDGETAIGWTFAGLLESGFYGAPNTYTGTISFNAAVTGSLVIKGKRAPRRQVQFAEGRGVPARDYNTEQNVLTAVDQELRRDVDDISERALRSADGETLAALPPLSELTGKVIGLDSQNRPVGYETNPIPLLQPGVDTVGSTELKPEAVLAENVAENLMMLTFPNRAAMQAYAPRKQRVAMIYLELGRNGLFLWDSSNLSTAVTNDPRQGIYVPPASDTSGASGAWVRQNFTPGEYQPEWFGALRGGANDYAAMAGCIAFMKSATAGTTGAMVLYGGYRIDTGLVLDAPLLSIIGKVGCRGASLFSPVANINLITVSASQCEVRNITGYNNVRSTVQSALLKLLPGAVKCTFDSLDLTGGYHCIWATGYLTDTVIRNCSGSYAIGGAITNLHGCGALSFDRVIMNQGWPVSQPSAGGAQDGGNWAPFQTYATGVFVRTGGFILQCVSGAGTTGGTAPDLTGKWYFQDIIDGGHVWRLVNNALAISLLVDSGCTYLTFNDCDHTGAFAQGIATTDNFGTVAPHLITFTRSTVGGTIDNGVTFVAGKTILGFDCEVQGLCGAGALAAGFYAAPSFAGNLTLRDCKARDGVKVGARLGNATAGRVKVLDCLLVGTSYGGLVDAGVKNFQFRGNGFVADGAASPVSIRVETGGSDYYVIEQNDLVGSSAISDAGTAPNYKRVQATAM